MRACIELGAANPIVSIHDQGYPDPDPNPNPNLNRNPDPNPNLNRNPDLDPSSTMYSGCGGNGNVLKEIIETNGADYDIRQIKVKL